MVSTFLFLTYYQDKAVLFNSIKSLISVSHILFLFSRGYCFIFLLHLFDVSYSKVWSELFTFCLFSPFSRCFYWTFWYRYFGRVSAVQRLLDKEPYKWVLVQHSLFCFSLMDYKFFNLRIVYVHIFIVFTKISAIFFMFFFFFLIFMYVKSRTDFRLNEVSTT